MEEIIKNIQKWKAEKEACSEKRKYITDKDLITELLIIIAMLAVIYFPNFKWLCHVWVKDPNFSFGFFIPLVTSYLIYKKFDKIRKVEIDDKKKSLGRGFILLAVLLYAVSTVLIIHTVSTYSLILLMLGISLYFLGGGITRYLIFPLSYLILMVPVTYVLLNPLVLKLKYFASYISAEIIGFVNIPVLREGAVIHLTNTTLEVVDACSGLRSMLALFAIGGVFVYLREVGLPGKLILLITIVPIAIAINILRILTLCFFSEKYGIDLASNELVHNASGIVVFVFGMVMLILTAKVVSPNEKEGWGR